MKHSIFNQFLVMLFLVSAFCTSSLVYAEPNQTQPNSNQVDPEAGPTPIEMGMGVRYLRQGSGIWRWRWFSDILGSGWVNVEAQDKGQWSQVGVMDVSGCRFCDDPEESDNCRQNTIQLLELDGLSHPHLLVVCHVGAHSQRASLFDPKGVKPNTPVRTATGSYAIQWILDEARLTVRYDEHSYEPNKDESPYSTRQETWP